MQPKNPGATLMYKILNDLSAPQLINSFAKLNDTNINYNLRNIETDLALPRPCTNFLKRSFKYSGGVMLWNNLSYEAKTAQSLSDFKQNVFPNQISRGGGGGGTPANFGQGCAAKVLEQD